jgi:hypothetical protein
MAERRSTKHGSRLDEELAHESEAIVESADHTSHVEEFRETEEPTVDEQGLPSDPVLARREVSRHLDSRIFPARRGDLLENAHQHQAPDQVIALLERLPGEAEFQTMHQLWASLQSLQEARLPGVDQASEEIDFEERSQGRRSSRDNASD